MRQDRQDELVSTSAIIAGAVAGVVVTAVSLWLHADELRVAPVTPDSPGISVEIIIGDDPAAPVAEAPAAEEADVWTDPRGPERGPTELEWDVIRAFKPIESMTADEPGNETVDLALTELVGYADDHPDNPYIQELYLKGLRIAHYYARDAGDEVRAALLGARFERHAAAAPEYEGVLLEAMAMRVQEVRQSCDGVSDLERVLHELAARLRTEAGDAVLLAGQRAAARCVAVASGN